MIFLFCYFWRRSFGGWAYTYRLRGMVEELIDELPSDANVDKSKVYVAGYDSPMTFMNRHKEVGFLVQDWSTSFAPKVMKWRHLLQYSLQKLTNFVQNWQILCFDLYAGIFTALVLILFFLFEQTYGASYENAINNYVNDIVFVLNYFHLHRMLSN